jgi:hypothetical protein
VNIEKADLFKQYYAERIFLSVCGKIEPGQWKPMVERGEFQCFEDLSQNIIFQFTTYMHGIQRERITVNLRWPADWWQALKARWFPRWWLARWPVKWEEYHIDEAIYAAVCPHVNPVTKNREHLMWMAKTFEAQRK